MEPQEYELTAFNVGNFKDAFGNSWCDAAFLGISEPVRIVVKDPSAYSVGQKLYGQIRDETSKAGKPYRRFHRMARPDFTPSITAEPVTAKPTWSRDDKAIQAQWAIGQAIQLFLARNDPNEVDGFAFMESEAKKLFAMIDRVKSGQTAKLEPTYTRQSPGSYEEDKIDAEFESMIASGNLGNDIEE